MITILYSRVEGDIAISTLLDGVRAYFQNHACASYIDALAAKNNENGARESLAALILLGRAAERMKIDTAELILSRTGNGKPYFMGSSLHFSITHSKGYIAVALSDKEDVGIDLEASEYDTEKTQRLAERYFNSSEIEEYRRAPEDFARIWTKKEAYVKLYSSTLAEQIAKGCVSDKFYRYFEVDGYPLTLCTRDDHDTVKILKEDF